MIAALIILIAIVAVGAVLYIHHRLTGGDSRPVVEPVAEGECCGMHAVCERDSLLTAIDDEIVYYADEELDQYKGRTPDSYTEQETELFRDVLLSLLPDDVAGWGRSVARRGIELPEPVRDEMVMMLAERRLHDSLRTPFQA